MWIQNEREQAQSFALRGAMMKDLDLAPVAKLFEELVELCDRKIELFKALDGSEGVFEYLRSNPKARNVMKHHPHL